MAAPPGGGEPGVLRRNAVALGFLLPAAVILTVMIVYPTIYTIIRSFYGKNAHEGFLPSGQFAGIDLDQFYWARQRAKRALLFWVVAVLTLTGLIAAGAWTLGGNIAALI